MAVITLSIGYPSAKTKQLADVADWDHFTHHRQKVKAVL
jgi:hypothetical protein